MGLGCLVVAGAATAAPSAEGTQAESVTVIDRAELVTANRTQAVPLPHKIDEEDLQPQRPGDHGVRLRYRLSVQLPALPQQDLAVYVPKMSLAGALSVNGRPAGACVVAPLEQARCLHQPQLFVPPRDAWVAGSNQLEFTLFANGRQPSGLSRVTVGDAWSLHRVRAWRLFWQSGLLQALTLALLVVGLLFLAAAGSALVAPQQRLTYRLLGISALVNALCDLNMLIQVPPVGFEAYSWFTFVARLESMPLYFLTLLAFYGALDRRILRITLLAMALMPLLVWGSGNQPWMVRLLYLPLGVAATAAFVYTLWLTWRSRRRDHLLMVAVSVVLLSAGWWDFVKVQGGLGFERLYMLPYAYPATLLVMAALLLDAMRAAMAAQQRLSVTLEQQLAEREAELRQAYADMREAEQRRIREEERSALALHMHDGLGSQLVTARAALASGEIDAERAARILGECSDDLRLILSTLHQSDASLASCVADFRHRLRQRLEGSGLAVTWEVSLKDMPRLDPEHTLQLLRILQEAVGNTIRHAHARLLHIRLVWRPQVSALEMTVLDDGIGFEVVTPESQQHPPAGRGLGLYTLRQRANKLGAELALTSSPGATCMQLVWQPA